MSIPENLKELEDEIITDVEHAGEQEVVTPQKLPPIWRNRDYMLLWSGQVISTLGSGISGIVFPLLILAITGSAEAAGYAGALGALPYLILSLPAGAYIDRWDRKKVMIICDTVRAVNMGSIFFALAVGTPPIWQLYVNALVEGIFFVFFNIAEVAALPRVVEKVQLPEATAQNQAAFAIAGIVAPSIGTTLFKFVGRMFPFGLDAVSYLISAISLFFIKSDFQLTREQSSKPRNLRAEIVEGLAWLWKQPLIRFMAFITGGLNFIGNGSFLILIVLAKNLGADDAAIGTIFSIGAIGGIAGSLVGGRIQKRFTFGQVIIAVVWIQAILFPFIAIAPHVLVLGAIAAVFFMTGPIYNVVQFSYRVAMIPDELQGRVNSAFRLLAFGFNPLGAALSGILIDRFGVIPAVIFFSFWGIVLGVMVTINSHVRNARPIEETQPA